ncbi:MAG: hypothetical protein NWQ54_00445 [Paraglaciecola sp.]|nr:hypothetical protein [Paraglaciecola sp.]
MSRRRAQKKKKNDVLGSVMIAVAFAVFAVGGYFLYENNKNLVARDKSTNCRVDGVVTSETVLLVDTTDSVNPTQYQAIKNKLNDLLDNSNIDERISVYTITEDPLKNVPLLVACNPGDGADKSEWTANKRRLKENWEQKFKEKLESTVSDILDADLATQSPIMEAIKAVGVYSFAASKADKKQLIVVSDLLHHTAALSHYKTPKLDFSKVEGSAYLTSNLANLNHAEVEILYLTRAKDHPRQGRSHILFWEKYFEKSKSVISRISNVN